MFAKTAIVTGLLAGTFLSACGAEFSVDALSWKLPKAYAKIEGHLLTVEIPPEKYGSTAMATAQVDVSLVKGRPGFSFSVEAWGENLAKPKQSYLGLKSQLHWRESASKREGWPNVKPRFGSFPRTRLTTYASFEGARPDYVALQLGLQGTSGKVVFDLSTLKPLEKEFCFEAENPDLVARYSARVTGDCRRRGVMMPERSPTEDDFRTLHAWGVNLIRYQMVRNWNKRNDNRDIAEYGRWLDGKLDVLEKTVLPLSRQYGMKVVVDVHVAPGGRQDGGQMAMFVDRTYADAFVACWQRIARRFRGNEDVIYGYDLINEPDQSEPSDFGYWELQKRAAEAVRAIDPVTTIIIESNRWDSPDAFSYLGALDMENVIYQVHMYQPFAFTHQGVHGSARGAVYPDAKKGWNVDHLKAAMRHVRDFELRHKAKIYVGEFSAIAWAEGAGDYLTDCISVFEEYGWDWTYHAFREFPGWSVEHEGEAYGKLRPSADNPRKRALLKGFRGGCGSK